MIKKNLRLKENITLYDRAKMIEHICDEIIGTDDNGQPFYLPYVKDDAMNNAIIMYMIEGIELEDNEDSSIVTTDTDVLIKVEEFRATYLKDIDYMNKMVDDIVEYRKQMRYHSNTLLDDKLAEIFNVYKILENLQLEIATKQNKLLTQQIKANERAEKMAENMTDEQMTSILKQVADGKFDVNKMMEVVAKEYFGSELHKTKEQELISAQQNKIADLSKYKSMYDARNVLSDIRSSAK